MFFDLTNLFIGISWALVNDMNKDFPTNKWESLLCLKINDYKVANHAN